MNNPVLGTLPWTIRVRHAIRLLLPPYKSRAYLYDNCADGKIHIMAAVTPGDHDAILQWLMIKSVESHNIGALHILDMWKQSDERHYAQPHDHI